MHCHSTFCVHLWLCPAAPPTGKSGGGGSAIIAVIGKIVMTSVSMSLICIPEIAANDIIVCMPAREGHLFLVAVPALVVAITIIASSSQ